MARRTHEQVIMLKQKKKEEATKYLRSLSPSEFLKHVAKRKTAALKFAKGSDAAKERAAKSATNRRASALNPWTNNQKLMLEEAWEDGIQVGSNSMWFYLKSEKERNENKGKWSDKVPTQRNILRFMKDQYSWQVDMRPKGKSLELQSGNINTTRPHQAGQMDLIQFGQTKPSYILHVIDSFTRRSYAKWLEPSKNEGDGLGKQDRNVAKKLTEILEENPRYKIDTEEIEDDDGNKETRIKINDGLNKNKKGQEGYTGKKGEPAWELDVVTGKPIKLNKPLFRRMTYDAGREFTSALTQKVLTEFKIKATPSPAGRSVVGVERANQTLMTWLTKWTDKADGITPQDGLPIVLRLMNDVVPSAGTGKTAQDIVRLDFSKGGDGAELAASLKAKAIKRQVLKHGKDDVEVGDYVRLRSTLKYKASVGKKAKFFTDNWTPEVFEIAKVIRDVEKDNSGNPIRATTYKIVETGKAVIEKYGKMAYWFTPAIKFTRNDIQKIDKTKFELQTDVIDRLNKEQAKNEAANKKKREEMAAKRKQQKEENAKAKQDKWLYAVKAKIAVKGTFFEGTDLAKTDNASRAVYNKIFEEKKRWYIGTITKHKANYIKPGYPDPFPVYYVKWDDMPEGVKPPTIPYNIDDIDEEAQKAPDLRRSKRRR